MKVMLLFLCLLSAMTTLYAQTPAYPEIIQVGKNTTTMLVFATPIKNADRGSADIIIQPVTNARHVLKVKAVKDDFTPTNLTVFTEDDKIFTITVQYNPLPVELAYNFTPAPLNTPHVGVPFLNQSQIETQAALIAGLHPITGRPAKRAYAMGMRLNGIYVKAGVMFFHFTMHNYSNVPYNLAFLRCYQRDKKKAKRSSHMEKEVVPRHFHQQTTIGPYSKGTYVVAMDQFTIADNKLFVLECFEKNGDRHLNLNIKGKHILRARQLR